MSWWLIPLWKIPSNDKPTIPFADELKVSFDNLERVIPGHGSHTKRRDKDSIGAIADMIDELY